MCVLKLIIQYLYFYLGRKNEKLCTIVIEIPSAGTFGSMNAKMLHDSVVSIGNILISKDTMWSTVEELLSNLLTQHFQQVCYSYLYTYPKKVLCLNTKRIICLQRRKHAFPKSWFSFAPSSSRCLVHHFSSVVSSDCLSNATKTWGNHFTEYNI